MTLIVGVDRRSSCEGALAFVEWLTDLSGANAVHRIAVHVVDNALRVHPPDLAQVGEMVRDYLGRLAPSYDVRVVDTAEPAAGLARAAALHGADALVIGRPASARGDEVVRLGAVARRLLARLPVPVVVCPRDLTPEDIRPGPVLLAAQPEPHCVSAARFAHELAQLTGRKLAVTTISAPAFAQGVTYEPTAAYRGEDPAETERELNTWLEEIGVAGAGVLTGSGPAVPMLLDAAAEMDACLVVCGSRLMTPGQRVTHVSVATALAGSAALPVVAVPPLS